MIYTRNMTSWNRVSSLGNYQNQRTFPLFSAAQEVELLSSWLQQRLLRLEGDLLAAPSRSLERGPGTKVSLRRGQQGVQALEGRSRHPKTLSGVCKTHIPRSLER